MFIFLTTCPPYINIKTFYPTSEAIGPFFAPKNPNNAYADQ